MQRSSNAGPRRDSTAASVAGAQIAAVAPTSPLPRCRATATQWLEAHDLPRSNVCCVASAHLAEGSAEGDLLISTGCSFTTSPTIRHAHRLPKRPYAASSHQ
ncbi:MAG: hypothetical protein H6946_07590 [Thauera sp.]|uniref:hypothetical protein n=1 Tax=Thauera sp. TaxID=1905334 RepID=UPI00261EAD89|nr:hypothetical protein [Thauera sp.]MCP5224977.1 hypothetical protein [Thauera sp.]